MIITRSTAVIAITLTLALAAFAEGQIADGGEGEGENPRRQLRTGERLPADSSDSSDSTTSDDEPNDRVCPPEANGEIGRNIRDLVRQQAEATGLRSVVYRVTKDGRVVAAGAVGDSLTGEPATQLMQFRTGNVAYLYLGTLMVLLEEEGTISLDDPMTKYLSDFDDLPNASNVTLGMLVRSYTGYRDYVTNPAFVAEVDANPFRDFTQQELIDYAFDADYGEPWCSPGGCWSYAHTNFVLLGKVLEAATGQTLKELIETKVIAQLGLSSTTKVQLNSDVPDPVLHTYTTERTPPDAMTPFFEETTYWSPSWQGPTGMIVTSSVCDQAASIRKVGRGELFADPVAGVRTMLNPVAASLPKPEDCAACRQWSSSEYYAMGFLAKDGWMVANPNFGGAGQVMAYLPSEDMAIAMISVTGPAMKETGGGTEAAKVIYTEIAKLLASDSPGPN